MIYCRMDEQMLIFKSNFIESNCTLQLRKFGMLNNDMVFFVNDSHYIFLLIHKWLLFDSECFLKRGKKE